MRGGGGVLSLLSHLIALNNILQNQFIESTLSLNAKLSLKDIK